MLDAPFLITYAVFFSVPLFRFVLWPARVIRPVPDDLQAVSPDWIEWLGRVEFYLSGPRDVLCVVAGVITVLVSGFTGVPAGWGVTPLALVFVSRKARGFANDRAIVQLLRCPDAHPDDFFRTWFRACSIWPPAGPVATRSVDPASLDYTARSHPWWQPLAFAHSVFDTANVAFLILHGVRTQSESEFRRVFDAATRQWSSRCAWHMRLKVTVSGLEHLRSVSSQAVIVFNHESVLDAPLSFFAVGGVQTARGRRIRARFLAARDHFYDNRLLHSVVGLGKAMVAAGFIFVDRHTEGGARTVVDDAVDTLGHHEVDVALFPQGTRAAGHFGADGRPFGAGYYTTARELPGRRHFRRGAAAIALGLARDKPVDVLCVAIVGAARIMPTGAVVARTHQSVECHVAEALRIERGLKMDETELLRQIELRLRRAARVNDRLLEAWRAEAGVDDETESAVRANLAGWGDAPEPLPYAILDAVLSMDPAGRTPWLDRFRAAALEGADEPAWEALRADVAAA